MKTQAFIVLALYALAAWFIFDHIRSRNDRESWEEYPDLGEVDVEDRLRKRELQEAEIAQQANELSGFAQAVFGKPLDPWQREMVNKSIRQRLELTRVGDGKRIHDLVTRGERMQHHPQRVRAR